MKFISSFLFLAIFLQACVKKDAEVEVVNTVPTDIESRVHKECGILNSVECSIPLEVALGRDFIGKNVRLKGVLIVFDDELNPIEGPKHFMLFSSSSAVEVCSESSGIGIHTDSEEMYAELLKNDGRIGEVFGILEGGKDNYLYYRYVKNAKFFVNSWQVQDKVNVKECGKFPPLG